MLRALVVQLVLSLLLLGAAPSRTTADTALTLASADPGLAALWKQARSHEDARRLLETAEIFERITELDPGDSTAYWRAARGYWLAADELVALEERPGRMRWFERSNELSARGIEVDPECAGCMLWKFAAMGRLRTARGVWTGIRQVPEMAELVDRGIELQPTYADGPNNSTLGGLHYSAAIFYRVMPDWFWLRWFLGVRGDKERALGHIRTALALHPNRVDYRVELASQLLCLGSTKEQPERLQQGIEAAKHAIAMPAADLDDEREIAAVKIMLAEPRKSCGYTGDTWLEFDEERARSMTGQGRSEW